MTHQLENKRSLVTGGSRGIGAAIVKRLAREGAHVALTYVSKPEHANETVTAARALGVGRSPSRPTARMPRRWFSPWSERWRSWAASTSW